MTATVINKHKKDICNSQVEWALSILLERMYDMWSDGVVKILWKAHEDYVREVLTKAHKKGYHAFQEAIEEMEEFLCIDD